MPKTAISPHGVKDPIGAVLAAKCFDETGGTATAREVLNGSGGTVTGGRCLARSNIREY